MVQESGSPVEVGSLSHYLQNFTHPRWLFGISSINSFRRNQWKFISSLPGDNKIGCCWDCFWIPRGFLHITPSLPFVLGQWRFVCWLKLPFFSFQKKAVSENSFGILFGKSHEKILSQYPTQYVFFGKIRSRSPQDSLFFLVTVEYMVRVCNRLCCTLEPLGREVDDSDRVRFDIIGGFYMEIGIPPNHPF